MTDSDKINRKSFLKRGFASFAGLSLLSWGAWSWLKPNPPGPIPGEIKGAAAKIGHLIREGLQSKPSQRESVDVLIVGAGVAGLSAAWELQRSQQSEFLILDLDEKAGGKAASGSSETSAYPWGAHYLPLPNLDNQDLLQLLQAFGCIEGYENGLPIYNPLHLCHSPQERLLKHGIWQEGIVPKVGLSEPEQAEMDRFFDFVNALRGQKGDDGRLLFTIPLDQSSADPKWRDLDQITFSEWMQKEGYQSEPLKWYLNYCCEDDFGTKSNQTSAWAGLHYFAARQGIAANCGPNSVLTWPQGNGWLIQQFEAELADHIRCDALVISIENTENGAEALVYYPKKGTSTLIQARKVIFAGPQFVARHVVQGRAASTATFSYAPWFVANLEVAKRPAGKGKPLAWDNVAYGSDSLGYIVAGHQSLARHTDATQLTWYKALCSSDPVSERKTALAKTYLEWQAEVLQDLEWMHPGIRADIRRLDVWIWGHGMIRPVPGFLWGEERLVAQKPHENIHFAHSDLSGISIFEEAFAQGLRAARACLEGGAV